MNKLDVYFLAICIIQAPYIGHEKATKASYAIVAVMACITLAEMVYRAK